MTDKPSTDKWETFLNAKGSQLAMMSMQQLYAEVRVNIGVKEVKPPIHDEAKALTTVRQYNTDRGRRCRKRNNKDDIDNHGGQDKGKRHRSRKEKFPYDPNKICELHGCGHSTDECIVLRKRRNETVSQQSSSNRGDYNPNFNRPSLNANVA